MFKEETLAEKFITKWFWLYFFLIFIAPTWYVVRLILSNTLSVSDIWIIYSILSFIALVSVYNDFWLTSSLTYFLPKLWIEKKFDNFKTAMFFTLFVQLFTAILIWFLFYYFSDWLSIKYFHNEVASKILKLFSIYFVFLNIYEVIHQIFLSFQDMFRYQFLEFIRMFSVFLITLFFFIYWITDTLYYSMVWIFWIIVALISSLFLFKKYFFVLISWSLKYDKIFLLSFIKYSLWVFIWANAWIILWNIDQQMIMYFLWSTQAWYYANYLSLNQLSLVVLWPLVWLIFPVMTELITKKQNEKIILLQNFIYKFFIVFALAIWAFFLVMWPIIASILYWSKFFFSWVLMQVLSPFIFLIVISSISYSILSAMWLVRYITYSIIIWWLINIVFNFFFIKLYWAIWSVIAYIISYSFISLITLYLVHKNYKFFIDWKYIIKNLFFILLFIFIFYYMIRWKIFDLTYSNIYKNIISLLLSLIFYILYLAFVNKKEIIYLINEIKNIKKQPICAE